MRMWGLAIAAENYPPSKTCGCRDGKSALHICQQLLHDTDKSVETAVEWALQEDFKSDATAVFALLSRHKTALPRAIPRATAEKLTAVPTMHSGWPRRDAPGVSRRARAEKRCTCTRGVGYSRSPRSNRCGPLAARSN